MELKFLKSKSLWEIADNSKWERWFAWYPVRLQNGECVFLEYVERKYIIDDVLGGPSLGREYRKI